MSSREESVVASPIHGVSKDDIVQAGGAPKAVDGSIFGKLASFWSFYTSFAIIERARCILAREVSTRVELRRKVRAAGSVRGNAATAALGAGAWTKICCSAATQAV